MVPSDPRVVPEDSNFPSPCPLLLLIHPSCLGSCQVHWSTACEAVALPLVDYNAFYFLPIIQSLDTLLGVLVLWAWSLDIQGLRHLFMN